MIRLLELESKVGIVTEGWNWNQKLESNLETGMDFVSWIGIQDWE